MNHSARIIRILSLIVKEFHAIWRDKKTRFLLIFPPIMEVIIFGFAATLDVKNVSVGILNEDRGNVGNELVQRINGSTLFTKFYYLKSHGEIKPMIDSQKAMLVLRLPQNLSRDVISGKGADVQVILDGRRTNSAQITLGYLTQIINGYNIQLLESTANYRRRPEIVARTWFNPNKIYCWFTIPSLIGTIIAIEVILITGLSVARERELGTFEQLLVSPLTPWEILLGKTIPSIAVGIFEGTLILVIAMLVFQIPFRGSFLYLYFSIPFYLLSIIGFGLFISSLAKTQQQAFLGIFVFIMPCFMLSGFLTPVENMPQWLQTLTIINPLRHFLVIVKGVFLKDMPFSDVMANIYPLICISAATLPFATWMFRKRLG
ncbi:MAG: ABC transporter permease [Lentisphaerae bacterium]|nr:ABC transporter permease [Lentisphaerota bacterium]